MVWCRTIDVSTRLRQSSGKTPSSSDALLDNPDQYWLSTFNPVLKSHMPSLRILVLTVLAMIAFAGNSLLCRLALKHTSLDPASFTSIRLLSGAIILYLLALGRSGNSGGGGNWGSATALFAYAASFSFAYVNLPAATGALLLFGAVQATMISHGLLQGERLDRIQWLGLLLAFGGVVGLLLPGITAPPLLGSLMMLFAGIAWGIYSLRGRGASNPIRVSAGNFIRAVPLALVCSLATLDRFLFDPNGLALAIASGALASGLGYAIWYSVLPSIKATTAATVQLSVPVIAALGGILVLNELLSWLLLICSVVILGGIVMVILEKKRKDTRIP
jgi:drug/metabolite transporter (DMT)-like permease